MFYRFIKKVFQMFFNIIKILFAIFIIFFFAMINIELMFGSEFSLQIIFYNIWNCFFVAFLFYVFFFKTKPIMHKLFVLLLIIHLLLTTYLPEIQKEFDIQDSLDNSNYTEGAKINTRQGTITINKENCLKYDWKWDEKRKMCKIAR